MSSRPVMLVILDGWGWREDIADNAVQLADTPNFDRLMAGPHAFLRTFGLDVGLPLGQMGNSEVGHLNIGAGRVVMQELPRIGQAIADGSLARNPALLDSINGTGGMLVFCIALIILELKKIELADYLPSLVFAPLIQRTRRI